MADANLGEVAPTSVRWPLGEVAGANLGEVAGEVAGVYSRVSRY